jgi:fatty-acyl-CoA synthase
VNQDTLFWENGTARNKTGKYLFAMRSCVDPIPETLGSLLEPRRASDAPALIERGRAIAFRALIDESLRVAGGLTRLGVAPGERVALWLPNVAAWLATFLACARIGAIAVSVNTRFRSHEVADILGRSGARVLLYWPGFKGIDFASILAGCDPHALERLAFVIEYAEGSPPARPARPGTSVITYEALAGAPGLAEDRSAPDAGCVIFTTSGTTRAPKFVLHDQCRVVAHALDVVRAFGIGPDAAMLLAPPLCGVFGFCSAMAALAAGRPLVMRPAWNAEEAARDLVAHRVTHANGTDDAVSQLLALDCDFSAVRFFGYAAFNPALGDIVARADARGLKLAGLYGTSEIQALFARQDEHAGIGERMLAGGRPVSALARVRCRDPETGRILGHGEAGELEFLAPSSRMAAYLGDPEASAAALAADGYYRSGDLGTTQADGRFVFLARIGDSLRLGGFLVSPAEIESVVQQAPGVAACQVVGVPRPEGLRPVAFVVSRKGSSFNEASVLSHVRGRLAAYKVPLRVFPVEAFPVTPGANATKIQKGKLRDMAQALLD